MSSSRWLPVLRLVGVAVAVSVAPGCGSSTETATHRPGVTPPADAAPSVTPPAVPTVCANGETPIVRDFSAPSVILGDVTGDGIDDWMEVEATSDTTKPFKILAGPWPGVEWATYESRSIVKIVTADVNQDGALDLAVAAPFASSISIFFGPIAKGSALGPLEASIVLRGLPPDELNGLSDQFGLRFTVADVTGDGAPDFVVARPAEQEEACFGSKNTVVFAGPFAPAPAQAVRWADAEPLQLGSDWNECLGTHLVEVADVTGDGIVDLVVAGATKTFVLPTPLTSRNIAEPTHVLPRAAHAIITRQDGAPSLMTKDEIGRLRLDDVNGGGVTFAEFPFSRSSRWEPLVPVVGGRVIREDDGIVANVDTASGKATIHIYAFDFGAPAAPLGPRLASFPMAYQIPDGVLYTRPLRSSGDLDHDGKRDLALGKVALFCP